MTQHGNLISMTLEEAIGVFSAGFDHGQSHKGPGYTAYFKALGIDLSGKEEKGEEVKKGLPPCGCTSGEDCNGDCVIPAWIAQRLLKIREALVEGDKDEAYHWLYSIACPDFSSYHPWAGLEDFANAKPSTLYGEPLAKPSLPEGDGGGEWKKFYGDYEKEMQDIKLHDGTVIHMCWPNAGLWMVCKGGEPGYGGNGIPVKEAAFVRKNKQFYHQ